MTRLTKLREDARVSVETCATVRASCVRSLKEDENPEAALRAAGIRR